MILLVMPGLVPGIHTFLSSAQSKTWMAGTSPAMTVYLTPTCALALVSSSSRGGAG
jgi:hypothetical protein